MSTPPSSGSQRNPVEALAEEFLQRQRRGERPSLEQYCRDHPQLAADIRDLFPVLIRIEDMGADSDGGSTTGEGTRPPRSNRLERLGDFRVLREVGRGGMGVVYEAEQESLGRRVALKVLPDSALSDPRQVLRFQSEARAAARLHHTNVVPVFGVGHEDGRHYYVMQFIPGMGLDAVLDELRRIRKGGTAAPRTGAAATAVAQAILTGRFSIHGARAGDDAATDTFSGPPAPTTQTASSSSVSLPGSSPDSLARPDPDRTFFRSVANIGRQVADALEYANRQGILHRDVKPSNLLLDPRGNVWVADFGLAKAADAADLTHTGDIVGTLRYMAPERFAGKCDARSDVYALGLTLYELLALRPAFEASDRHALMRLVMNAEPEPLGKLVPHLPRDLVTIVDKAIAREPAGRYATAAAMAEDLQLFLDDRPIRARRATAREQAWRWAHRNPAVASLAAGLSLTLLAGLIAVTMAWRQASDNLALAERANRKAEARSTLAMEAIQSFTSGASEDVLLREKQLSGLRGKLLESSLTFYDRLASLLEGETDQTSRRSLASAVFDAAELNGRIGRREKALEVHRKALVLRQGLAKEVPGDVEARREVGRSELALGQTLAAMGRSAEARQAFARSRSVAEEIGRVRPADIEAMALLGDGLLAEGRSLLDEWHLSEARPFLVRALETYDRIVRESSPAGTEDAPERYLRGRARCSYQLGLWSKEYGPSAEGLAASESAVSDYEALVRRSPGDVGLWLELAECHGVIAQHLVNYVDHSDLERLRHIQRIKAICERLARANPTVTSIRATWAEWLASGANADRPHSTSVERRALLRDREHALAISRELVASDPEIPKHVIVLAYSLAEVGSETCREGRFDQGISLSREAADVLERSELARSSQLLRREQTLLMTDRAGNLALAGRGEEALVVLRTGITRDDAYTGPRESRIHRRNMSQCYLLASYLEFAAGLRAEAAESAERAAAELETLTNPTTQDIWSLAGLETLWVMEGRQPGPRRLAEPPGRLEHATRAIALLRQAADRGCVRLRETTAFFGPVLGHLPEFQQLMLDLRFPSDPFLPMSDTPDDRPLPPASGASP